MSPARINSDSVYLQNALYLLLITTQSARLFRIKFGRLPQEHYFASWRLMWSTLYTSNVQTCKKSPAISIENRLLHRVVRLIHFLAKLLIMDLIWLLKYFKIIHWMQQWFNYWYDIFLSQKKANISHSTSHLFTKCTSHRSTCRLLDVCFQVSKSVNILVLLKLNTTQAIKIAGKCIVW